MKLHDHMEDAVSDVAADLPALAATARERGLAERRRRWAFTAIGAAAAASVIVGGTLALQGVGGTSDEPSVASVPAPSIAELSGETAPITGRATVAALMAAVDEVADGTFSEPGGSDVVDFDPDTLADNDLTASFRFTPDGARPGEVFANVQSFTATYEEADQPKCEESDPDCKEPINQRSGPYDECESSMVGCEVTRLGGGDVLRTYRDPASQSPDPTRTAVAELISPRRDLRLVVSATDDVLDAAALGDVVTQPWWDLDALPVEYAEAGEALTDYNADQGVTREGMPSPAE